MKEPHKSFQWMAFLMRISASTAAATWWLVDRVHEHDRAGAIVAAATGYVLLPILGYVYTDYRSRRPLPRYTLWIAKHLTRRKGKSS
jgi:hypothetical protein